MKKLLFVLALCLMARSAEAGVGDVNGISYETSVTATGRNATFGIAYWKYASSTWSRAYFSASGVIDASGVVHVAGIPPAVFPEASNVQICVQTGAYAWDVYVCSIPAPGSCYAILLHTPVSHDTSCTPVPSVYDPNPQPGNGEPPANPPTDPPTGPGGPA